MKKQSALSVGNILGANILDLTLIMPLCALVAGKPLPISAASARLDLPACLEVAWFRLWSPPGFAGGRALCCWGFTVGIWCSPAGRREFIYF